MNGCTGDELEYFYNAYNSIYLTENTEFFEDVDFESWIGLVIEEGVDVEKYTLDELYEAYLEEQGRRDVSRDRTPEAIRSAGRAFVDTAKSYGRGFLGKTTDSTNPAARAANAVSRTVSAPTRALVRGASDAFKGPGTTYRQGRYGGRGREAMGGSQAKPTPGSLRDFGKGYRGQELQLGRAASNSQIGTNRQDSAGTGAPPSSRSQATPTPTPTPAPTPGRSSTPAPTPGRSSTPSAKPSTSSIKPTPSVSSKPSDTSSAGPSNSGQRPGSKINSQLTDIGRMIAKSKARQGLKPTPSPSSSSSPARQMAAQSSVRTGTTGGPVSPSSPARRMAAQSSVRTGTTGGSVSPSSPARRMAAQSSVRTGTTSGGRTTQLFHIDLYDLVKGHLLDEGFLDNEESVDIFMANMSPEWINSIIESELAD